MSSQSSMINLSPLPPIVIWRPKAHPYLEVIEGHPLQGYSGHLHLHEDLEIAWKPHGQWCLVIRGITHQMHAGQVVLTRPEEAHLARSAPGESNLSPYIGMRFQTAFLHMFAADVSVSAKANLFAFSSSFIEDPNFSCLLSMLHRGLMSNTLTLLQQDGLIQHLMTAIRSYAKGSLNDPAYAHETLIIQKVKSYIREHYQEPIRLQQLAELTNMNTFYLNRMFASHVDLPPHTFQLQLRISRANLFLCMGSEVVRYKAG